MAVPVHFHLRLMTGCLAEPTVLTHYYVFPVSVPCPDSSADIDVIAVWLWALAAVTLCEAAVVMALHKSSTLGERHGRSLQECMINILS